MNQLDQLSVSIQPVLEEFQAELYEISWETEQKNKILRIAVCLADGSMDIDTCATISEKISQILDTEDPFGFEYFLEVCSPGAERALRSTAEIIRAIGQYVCVILTSGQEVLGDLIAADDQLITLQVRQKAVSRRIEYPVDQISRIRLAVKL